MRGISAFHCWQMRGCSSGAERAAHIREVADSISATPTVAMDFLCSKVIVFKTQPCNWRGSICLMADVAQLADAPRSARGWALARIGSNPIIDPMIE